MTEHVHYPMNPAEGLELYDDLRDFAGLTHEQALETIGFKASYEIWACAEIGALAAFLIVTEKHAYPATFHPDDQSIYMRGAELGAREATMSRELQNV